MKVKKVMHKDVTWVSPIMPITELAKKMLQNDVGALPVGENDRLIGMVTDRDIVCRGLTGKKEASKLTARDVMSKGMFYCREDDDVDAAIDLMKKKKVRRLTVLNDKKRMVGMLSLGDLSSKTGKKQYYELMGAVSAHHA